MLDEHDWLVEGRFSVARRKPSGKVCRGAPLFPPDPQMDDEFTRESRSEIMGSYWAASVGPIATAMNDKPKAVFSHTLMNAGWGPAEILSGELSAEIANLKAREDQGTILVHGGPGLAASLTRLGLVDEYQLSTIPIAIGAGRSPFAKLDQHLKLEVVEEQRFRSGALAQILVPRQ